MLKRILALALTLAILLGAAPPSGAAAGAAVYAEEKTCYVGDSVSLYIKADDLPQGQTKKEFAFYGVDIDGDRDIQFVVFLHYVPLKALQK